jgi:uncharacterized membrane protein YcaP (DUF421 family)
MPNWIRDTFSHPPTMMAATIIAAKTAVIYFFLVAGLRLMGKRELGQMTIYDLVLIIVLANAVQNAMVGNDTTLAGGLIAATTLLVLNRLFAILMTRSPAVERFMVGEPVLIVNDGELLADRMARESITHEQVMAALREHGLNRLEDVHMAVLEVDGTISVVPNTASVHRTRRHYRALRLP